MNGYWANWGYDDRTVGIRVPPGRGATTRLEQRTADGAANPYLAAAAILHGSRLGGGEGAGAARGARRGPPSPPRRPHPAPPAAGGEKRPGPPPAARAGGRSEHRGS